MGSIPTISTRVNNLVVNSGGPERAKRVEGLSANKCVTLMVVRQAHYKQAIRQNTMKLDEGCGNKDLMAVSKQSEDILKNYNKTLYYLYILKCSDNSLYTGITNNLKLRFQNHLKGTGSKYVRTRLPFKHIYTENYQNRSKAAKREAQIKAWSRDKKIKILNLKCS